MSRFRVETLGFVLLGTAYFVYLALRAAWLPITHDEAATCANHVPRGVLDLLTYRTDATPNNHILNTLGVSLFTALFGLNPLAARLPSLIGGLLYILAAGGLARRFADHAPAVRWFAFIVLLGNAYLAEFFSLSRGYGLAAGLMLFGIWQAWRYLENGRRPALLLAMGFGSLAVLANFTLTNFYLPFVALLAWAVWEKSPRVRVFLVKSWPVWSMLVFMVMLCYEPFRRMSATDQFRFWGTSGFWTETLLPLVKPSTCDHAYFGKNTAVNLSWLVVLTCLTAWIVVLVRWLRYYRKIAVEPHLFVTVLLFGTVLTNLVQFQVAGVPYLNSRTAVFFYPLFALLLAALAAWSWERWRWRSFFGLAPTAAFVLLNFWNCANLRKTTDWGFDQGTYVVLDYLKDRYAAEQRTTPFTLDAGSLLHNSLGFHCQVAQPNYGPWVTMSNWHGDRPPEGDTEFYYALDDKEMEICKAKGYEVVLPVDNNMLYLMRRK